MLKIAICDDSPDTVYSMKNYVSTYCRRNGIEFSIATYSSGDDFLSEFQAYKFPLIFLDIEMGEGPNGIEVAKNIWFTDKRAAIVFITGHEEYVYDAIEMHPFYYLVKPISQEKINQIIKDYFNIFEEQDIYFRYKKIEIRMQSICYIEKCSDKLVIVTDGDELEEYGELKNVIHYLDESFVRCHKGFIVNMNKIIHVQRRDKENELRLLGCSFPISIGGFYLKDFLKAYVKHGKRHWRYKG